jgi:hypothetical protein
MFLQGDGERKKKNYNFLRTVTRGLVNRRVETVIEIYRG